jgi:hypothetical protein
MSTITVTSQPNLRILYRKDKMPQWWQDPEYQAIEAEFIRENPVCEYCGRPSTVAHHDEDWMYKSREAYFDPKNMTPVCGPCHFHYRRGLRVCPTCKKNGIVHYMQKGADECSLHGTYRKKYRKNGRYKSIHPCAMNVGPQRCSVHGVCCYAARKAKAECRWFVERVKKEEVRT